MEDMPGRTMWLEITSISDFLLLDNTVEAGENMNCYTSFDTSSKFSTQEERDLYQLLQLSTIYSHVKEFLPVNNARSLSMFLEHKGLFLSIANPKDLCYPVKRYHKPEDTTISSNGKQSIQLIFRGKHLMNHEAISRPHINHRRAICQQRSPQAFQDHDSITDHHLATHNRYYLLSPGITTLINPPT